MSSYLKGLNFKWLLEGYDNNRYLCRVSVRPWKRQRRAERGREKRFLFPSKPQKSDCIRDTICRHLSAIWKGSANRKSSEREKKEEERNNSPKKSPDSQLNSRISFQKGMAFNLNNVDWCITKESELKNGRVRKNNQQEDSYKEKRLVKSCRGRLACQKLNYLGDLVLPSITNNISW